MRKRWRVAAVCVCVAMLACACSAKTKKEGPSAQPEAAEEKEETPEEAAENAKQAKLEAISPSAYGNIDGLDLEPGTYFSVIGKSESEEYWKAVKEGAVAAVNDLNEALGFEGADKLKVVYSGPGESDNVDEQVSILDEELDRYPSALAIAVIDSKSCNVQFDLATQNGIPIVTYDSASSYQGTMADITTNNAEAAAEAAVHMAEALGEEGQVLVFAHDSKSLTSQQRVESFVNELQSNHPEVTVTETYYMDKFDELKKQIARERAGIADPEDGDAAEVSDEDRAAEEAAVAEAAQAITDDEVYDYIFEKNPDIKGIYATNGESVVKMADLCEQKEKEDIVIMGYDADAEEVQALKDGRIAGVVMQNPYGMGYAAIVAEARCVLELGNEAEIDTGYTWVTADNVNDKEVQRMLYAK